MTPPSPSSLRRGLALVLAMLLAAGTFAVAFGPASAAAQPDKKDAAKDGKDKAAAPAAPQGPPPALVRVGSVASEELQPRWQVIGRLREVRRVIVGIGAQGRVIDVPFEDGDEVVGGKTVLAQIDETFARIAIESGKAQLAQAKAEVAEAEANLEQATRDRVYYEELSSKQATQKREMENARSSESVAKARLDRAKAAVLTVDSVIRVAEEELIRFRSIAPFDGVIIKKWMEVGQWVQKGAPIAELVSRGQIDAVVDVPERVVNSITQGLAIELQVDALKIRVEGMVDALIPEGSSTARTFPVKIRLDDQKGKLKAGMSVTAWLPTGDKQAVLTVPRDAVLTSAAGNVLWIVADGKALKMDVDILFGTGDRYAIAVSRRGGAPLTPGTPVVIEGAERIFFPGQSVVIAK